MSKTKKKVRKLVSKVKQNAKAFRHFKVDPVQKIDEKIAALIYVFVKGTLINVYGDLYLFV